MFKKIDQINSIILEKYKPKDKDNFKHIALLMGGISTEKEVSISSGMPVLEALKNLEYEVTAIDMGRDIASILAQIKPDIVFNALHGSYGEDGSLPGLLEIMGIAYTHSGVAASAIAMDKIISKALFRYHNIKTIPDMIVHKDDNIKCDPMERPYVIKPINEGSSVGVHLIFQEDDFDFKDYKFDYGDRVMIEKYIPGREIQVAILENKAIGAIEIIPKGRFYDYEAKYTDGMATHLMPAPLTEKAHNKVLDLAKRAHDAIGCKGISRVDFRYDEEGDGEFYILEVNTHPGMTPLSLVPEIANYYGVNFAQFVESLIKEAQA
jgi:D-alanine-D-alanine ligase